MTYDAEGAYIGTEDPAYTAPEANLRLGWQLDTDGAQAAKDRLGIEYEIDVCVLVGGGQAYLDIEPDVLASGCVPIVIPDQVTGPFADWAIRHELAHARQLQLDYGGDVEAFADDYEVMQRDFETWGGRTDGPRSAIRWHYAPWEAEAWHTARELSDITTARPGPSRVTMAQTYPGGIRRMGLDWKLIEGIALDYREGMGR